MKSILKSSWFLLPLMLWGIAVAMSWNEVEGPEAKYASSYKYGQSDLVPKWMPKPWMRSFLKEIHLESSEALFARRLEELSMSLSSAPWVKEVRQIRRNYSGDMTLSLEVRRPLCVLSRSGRQVYLSEDLQELRTLGPNPHQLNQESIPVVDVARLSGIDLQKKEKWLMELAAFLGEWRVNDDISEALDMTSVEMVPSGGAEECRLVVMAKDNRFKRDVVLNWGVHRDYNELEDRRSKEKWVDLGAAVAQSRPFSALDLRYKKPELRF